ncbi:MAG: Rid family hydrolase [Candidatus Brocadiia bacterium]
MIRKVCCEGVGYAVADLNAVQYVFASAVPQNGSGLAEQAHGALATIARVVDEEGPQGAIVRQTIFVRDAAHIPACRQLIGEFYGPELPATDYVVQPPCEDKLLAIEAWGVSRKHGPLAIERVSEHLVVLRHSGIAWAHCAGMLPRTEAPGVHERALSAFARLRETLASQGFGFDQVVRTWLYLGDIVGEEDGTQRYKELNRARADFYQDVSFLAAYTPPSLNGAVYPASTGIGASDRDLRMSAVALASDRRDLVVVPLENPLQTSAFRYAERYSPHSPKFSRAMAIVGRRNAAILISGTASIVESEVHHLGDVEAQTRQTLDNVEALIARENLQRRGIHGLGASLGDLVLARVYIKRPEDYAAVRAVCERRLGDLPTVYAVADVCRPELLVEIEGVAMARKA